MADPSFSLSPKVKAEIDNNIQALIDRTYTETNIRELLISLRKIARRLIDRPGTDPKENRALRLFSEVGAFIAHPDTNGGVIPKIIKEFVRRIDRALKKGGEKAVTNLPAPQALSGDEVVDGLLSTVSLYLSLYESRFHKDQLLPVFEDKADISLCIISILQNLPFVYFAQNWRAILYVKDNDYFYGLYCKVHNPPASGSTEKQAHGSRRVSLSFPIMDTAAPNLNGIYFDDRFAIPPPIETYRAGDDRIHVRFLSLR